jgi:hypothetical protein
MYRGCSDWAIWPLTHFLPWIVNSSKPWQILLDF